MLLFIKLVGVRWLGCAIFISPVLQSAMMEFGVNHSVREPFDLHEWRND